MSREFKWYSWNFDDCGESYVIAKDECPNKEVVPHYIIEQDHLDPECALDIVVEEGWCAFQVRSDWFDCDGPHGWYVVTRQESDTRRKNGKRKPGWFPVWIVRKGEWY